MGAAGAAPVASQGAVHRPFPGEASGAPAILRARHHRDAPPQGLPVGGGPDGPTAARFRGRGDRPMRGRRELLDSLDEQYSHAVMAFLDPEGYPLSVATSFRAEPERGVVVL